MTPLFSLLSHSISSQSPLHRRPSLDMESSASEEAGKERERSESQQEDSEDESEILEESPCGRWLKRREEVSPAARVAPLMRLTHLLTCSWRTA